MFRRPLERETDRDSILTQSFGLTAETVSLLAAGGTQAVVSQRLYVSSVGLSAGDLISNVCLQITTAAAGTAPTLVKVGIADSAGVMLQQSANLAASAIWTASGIVVAPLAAAVPITADGLYNLMYLQNGTWGTTNVTFANSGLGNANSQVGSGPKRYRIIGGQTDLPANGVALAAGGGSTTLPWMGCN